MGEATSVKYKRISQCTRKVYGIYVGLGRVTIIPPFLGHTLYLYLHLRIAVVEQFPGERHVLIDAE